MEEANFYDNCPKLSQDARDKMEAELSETELRLKTCTSSIWARWNSL
jgi:hypothetical protein